MIAIPTAVAQEPRPMEVADLFTLEQLGLVTTSPDGTWLAVVIARARTGAETYRDFPGGPADADHSDIWLVNTVTGALQNITNGRVDGAGYWSPTWSPDGRRLAMLSTKGGDNTRPFVWDMSSRRLTRLSDLGFEMAAYGDESWPAAPLIWSDDTTLICALRAQGSPPSYYGMSKIRSTAMALESWANAAQGDEATASVLDSDANIVDTTGPTGQVVAIDVVSGQSRVLANGNIRKLQLDPTRRRLALVAASYSKAPSRRARLQAYMGGSEEWWHTRLAIVGVNSRTSAQWLEGTDEPTTGRFAILGDHPHSWAPDGSLVAVVVKSSKDSEAGATVAVVSAATGQVRKQRNDALDVQTTAWSTGGQLLALARPLAGRAAETDSSRSDWWAIDPKTMDGWRNVTAKLKSVPQKLMRTAKDQIMLGLAACDLWSIDVRTGAAVNLTEAFQPRITTVAWPAIAQQRLQPQRTLIVEAADRVLYRLDWDGATVRTSILPTPSAGASLEVFRPESGLLVFTQRTSKGAFLWIGDGTGRFEERIALNRHVAQIADAARTLIEYPGTEGDSLKGVLLLPIGYTLGTRYPLLTFVYPGTMVKDTLTSGLDKQSVGFLNLYLLAARGYVVLIPSIPLGVEGQPSDPYIDIPKGVMTAVDKVIDLGIADPERIAVMGHSYGGYGVLSLLTYTRRFKAGIAIAGSGDLLSLYGTLFPSRRYEPHPLDELFHQALAESGQIRMGGPPWRDAARYLRNSPYYLVDRVQTPLMLIQGDMDYVPMSHGEQFFAALYRQGKRAKFVRYWGEGHVITSPANIKDMWQRIFGWLDQHLSPTSPPDSLQRTSVDTIAR